MEQQIIRSQDVSAREYDCAGGKCSKMVVSMHC